MRLIAGLAFCVAVLATAPANAGLLGMQPTGTIRDDRPDASYLSLATNYPSVGLIQNPLFLASGTLIGADWVLTAAHVIVGVPANQYSFTVGGATYFGAEVFVEPTWTGSLYAGNDVALIRLASSVTNVAPARYSGATSEVGRVGTYVGYGATGTGTTGATIPGGVQRAGQNVLDVTADFFNGPGTPANRTYSDRILMSDFDSPFDPSESSIGSPNPLDLEFNVASGDSGGGLFIDFGFGDLLAGVTSFLAFGDDTANADYGDFSGATRTSSHVAFIQNTTGIAPASVPEPSSTVLLLTIAVAGGAWRSRRRFVTATERSA
ncbi:MAG: trypsin-like serine protease [Planctomycetaceae bacterium]|nr:trypsin-like serine protease [Planctomycetaceae bacterium]